MIEVNTGIGIIHILPRIKNGYIAPPIGDTIFPLTALTHAIATRSKAFHVPIFLSVHYYP